MTRATTSETETRFRADPSAALGKPAVTATFIDGWTRLGGGSFTWDADLPQSIGGGNAAPSPTAYLLGALAGCAVAFLHDTLAPQLGVRIDGITATARCSTDARGLLGMDGVSPALADLALDIEITSPDGGEVTGPMPAAWQERCPIYLALLRPGTLTLATRVRANGS